MNTIAIAVLAAISIDFSSQDTEHEEVLRAYTKLKDMLGEKFGSESDVLKAVKALESYPKSKVYGERLEYETTKAEADQDLILVKLAQDLLDAIKTRYGDEKILTLTCIESAQTSLDDYWTSYSGSLPAPYGSQQILPGDPTTDAPPPPQND